jgi:hypothetical protein
MPKKRRYFPMQTVWKAKNRKIHRRSGYGKTRAKILRQTSSLMWKMWVM